MYKKFLPKLLSRLFLLVLTLSTLVFTGCTGKGSGSKYDLIGSSLPGDYNEEEKIIVLYTNDVHCNADENIGYDGLSAYRKRMLAETPNVALVDSGDHTTGLLIGNNSNGKSLIRIMNKTGYDFAALGNHEFDFGVDALIENIKSAEFTYLNCNVKYTGTKTDPFIDVPNYVIENFGKTKIAFIGVSTPTTPNSINIEKIQEDDRVVFDFAAGNNGQDFYNLLQNQIDNCITLGANYVVLVAHLGTDAADGVYNSKSCIKNISGVDVVLDGHAHAIIPGEEVLDKDGKKVLLTSTGTGLNYIGKLSISKEGLRSELIGDFTEKDPEITQVIKKEREEVEKGFDSLIGESNTKLSIYRENGTRIVRNRESTLGNFVADSLKYVTGTEISVTNGGGVRADLNKGSVSRKDFYNISPFKNRVLKVTFTGKQLYQLFEISYTDVVKEAFDSGETQALGESGEFLQVSGVKVVIDSSVPSPVKLNAEGDVIDIDGPSRISSLQVLVGGVYEVVDNNKTYEISMPDYVAIKFNEYASSCELIDEVVYDSLTDAYDVVSEQIIQYFLHLNGDLSNYASTEGRVIVK